MCKMQRPQSNISVVQIQRLLKEMKMESVHLPRYPTYQLLYALPRNTTLNISTLQVRQIIPSLMVGVVLILRNIKLKRLIPTFKEYKSTFMCKEKKQKNENIFRQLGCINILPNTVLNKVHAQSTTASTLGSNETC